ncbi:hypothetical protein P152DRAFT_506845 [Eremomyces bilateralis CBS 781.70]|uniref:alpha-1,2-Mannosidase n=1 Tax=Eremomyces bilateralis CBS 781.70 TaxID=1392243 RepID=A0A6G1G5F2_9PEZI|nr:uncharacterized protein P152DRAFT_506845 [Eremomyces bilateralis CBS 781.70]KAF1813171.1 hypothetical protein P152DRAFT_506845 [Eremomyces bilateralis CBS 781.70]
MRPSSLLLAGTIDRAGAVKEAFQFAWDGYFKYAYPNDELRPVSNTYSNSRNGWGASAVDSLSTACIMRLPEVIDTILKHVSEVNFSRTGDLVNLFETTIRYLGGLLSGYDLLTGPLSDLCLDQELVNGLLDQAQNLADILSVAFRTRTGIPFNRLNITDNGLVGDGTNHIATIGTLVLEWTRLSDILGDPKYGSLAEKAESYLLDPQPPAGEPFPGLIGTTVNISTGEIMESSGSWGGGDDSFYEYLIKMYTYDPQRFSVYRDRWILAVDSTITYLQSHPSSRPDLTFVAAFHGTTPINSSSHLACFHGGNFILGGLVLNRTAYIDFGLKLVNGCHQTYVATATRIGPEGFSWDTSAILKPKDEDFKTHGFYITGGSYALRPEVIESYYYAYRATGDQQYQEWAWDAFVAINATTRTASGFSSISDVDVPGGGKKLDMQESFLFAEVFKYAYLIFAEDDEWQVPKNGKNTWVFNTEAHPLRAGIRGYHQ